jgi:ParB-like chromosome segregation protein Spo0J
MTNEHIAEPARWNKMGSLMAPISNIQTLDRIILPTQARIDAIAKSLAERGQIAPILIRSLDDGTQWAVVVGATRLAAAAQLGWPEIAAVVIEANNEPEYQLIEIAENLDRYDLTETERKKLKAKAKKLRAKQLAHFEELLQPKPELQHEATGSAKNPSPAVTPAPERRRGRPSGGVSAAAREAGIPKSTAHRHAEAISSQNEDGTKKPMAVDAGTQTGLAASNDVDAEASAAARKASYAEPDTYSPESWAAKTPKERKQIVAGWGPAIISEMKFHNLPADLLAELGHRAHFEFVECLRKQPAAKQPDIDKLIGIVSRAVEKQRGRKIAPVSKSAPTASPDKAATPSDEPEDIPLSLQRLTQAEAEAVASAINANNRCTDQRVESDGKGGLQMVQLNADGSIDTDCKPENFELSEAADYDVDVEAVRRQVAAAANIRIINKSSEKVH